MFTNIVEMEPKEKMYSETRDEIKNSEEKSELEQVKVSEETEAENSEVADVEAAVEEIVAKEEIEEAVEEQIVNEVVEESTDETETAVEEVAETVTVAEETPVDEVPVAEEAVEEADIEETVVEEPAKAEAEEVSDAPSLAIEEEQQPTDVVVESEMTTAVEEKVEEVEKSETVVSTDEEADEDTSAKEAELEVVDGKADDAEPVAEHQKTEELEIDYTKLTEPELIEEFKKLLDDREFMEIHRKVDAIKINFYKRHKTKVQEQRKKFLDDGGYEEEFKAEPDPYEVELKNLMALYRQKKIQYNKLFEAEKDENLKRKYEIIEEIKGLVNRKESINKTFQEFKELQQQWREIGLVPQASVKDLWENYHHHVENFYDYIKINKELRDLDLKKNLEEKIILCEKAEALLLESSIIRAFNSLQKLHDSWREIGPAPNDKKEEVWERFKDATNQINKKHQDFFENRKKSQKKNLDAKTELCDKVDEIILSNIDTHKDWEARSRDIVEYQKYWRTIGFAPKKDNNLIYDRFRAACDRFFDKKREFYSKHKEIQTNNLQMKIDLCVQAEALKESTDWKKATEEYISIQKKWKEIGPIPRKHSDIVWKRFRAACDYFFERKSRFFSNVDESQGDNLKLKNDLIEEVKSFKPIGNDADNLEAMRTFQRRWTDIGHVPIANKNEIQKRFREAINLQFDSMLVDDRDRNLLRFKSKVSDWKDTSRGHNKTYAERDKYASKLRQLESDLITLKNNIGFFSNSKNAEALIKDVERKIEHNEEQIVYLKEKIRIIDDLDSNEE